MRLKNIHQIWRSEKFRFRLSAGTLFVALSLALVPAHAITYAIDTPPYAAAQYEQGNDVIAFNSFVAIPGATTIGTISVLWADEAAPQTVTLALFEDPNDDGFFSDAVLLQSIDVLFDGVGTGAFQDYSIAATEVSGVFGVGAYIEDGPGGAFPVLFELDVLTRQGGFSGAAQFSDIVQAARSAAPFNDVAIRATSVDAVLPEPGSLALLGLALAGLGFGRRITSSRPKG